MNVSVAKVVNPLGTVTTITTHINQEDEENNKLLETYQSDQYIHENCDESMFRPVVTILGDLKAIETAKAIEEAKDVVRPANMPTQLVVPVIDETLLRQQKAIKTEIKVKVEEKKIKVEPPKVDEPQSNTNKKNKKGNGNNNSNKNGKKEKYYLASSELPSKESSPISLHDELVAAEQKMQQSQTDKTLTDEKPKPLKEKTVEEPSTKPSISVSKPIQDEKSNKKYSNGNKKSSEKTSKVSIKIEEPKKISEDKDMKKSTEKIEKLDRKTPERKTSSEVESFHSCLEKSGETDKSCENSDVQEIKDLEVATDKSLKVEENKEVLMESITEVKKSEEPVQKPKEIITVKKLEKALESVEKVVTKSSKKSEKRFKKSNSNEKEIIVETLKEEIKSEVKEQNNDKKNEATLKEQLKETDPIKPEIVVKEISKNEKLAKEIEVTPSNNPWKLPEKPTEVCKPFEDKLKKAETSKSNKKYDKSSKEAGRASKTPEKEVKCEKLLDIAQLSEVIEKKVEIPETEKLPIVQEPPSQIKNEESSIKASQKITKEDNKQKKISEKQKKGETSSEKLIKVEEIPKEEIKIEPSKKEDKSIKVTMKSNDSDKKLDKEVEKPVSSSINLELKLKTEVPSNDKAEKNIDSGKQILSKISLIEAQKSNKDLNKNNKPEKSAKPSSAIENSEELISDAIKCVDQKKEDQAASMKEKSPAVEKKSVDIPPPKSKDSSPEIVVKPLDQPKVEPKAEPSKSKIIYENKKNKKGKKWEKIEVVQPTKEEKPVEDFPPLGLPPPPPTMLEDDFKKNDENAIMKISMHEAIDDDDIQIVPHKSSVEVSPETKKPETPVKSKKNGKKNKTVAKLNEFYDYDVNLDLDDMPPLEPLPPLEPFDNFEELTIKDSPEPECLINLLESPEDPEYESKQKMKQKISEILKETNLIFAMCSSLKEMKLDDSLASSMIQTSTSSITTATTTTTFATDSASSAIMEPQEGLDSDYKSLELEVDENFESAGSLKESSELEEMPDMQVLLPPKDEEDISSFDTTSSDDADDTNSSKKSTKINRDDDEELRPLITSVSSATSLSPLSSSQSHSASAKLISPIASPTIITLPETNQKPTAATGNLTIAATPNNNGNNKKKFRKKKR